MQEGTPEKAHLEFQANKETKRSYRIRLRNGTVLTGRPFKVLPTDPFFVFWEDKGGKITCIDFLKLESFEPLQEPKKISVAKKKAAKKSTMA